MWSLISEDISDIVISNTYPLFYSKVFTNVMSLSVSLVGWYLFLSLSLSPIVSRSINYDLLAGLLLSESGDCVSSPRFPHPGFWSSWPECHILAKIYHLSDNLSDKSVTNFHQSLVQTRTDHNSLCSLCIYIKKIWWVQAVMTVMHLKGLFGWNMNEMFFAKLRQQ